MVHLFSRLNPRARAPELAVAYLENHQCKLVSRSFKQLRFASLAKALATVPAENAIIDGEIVCLDASGVSRFNDLLNRNSEPVLYAFDLLWLNDADLRKLPLIERKRQLCELARSGKCERIVYAQHVEGTGKRFFEAICARDLEGIVAKRKREFTKTMAIAG